MEFSTERIKSLRKKTLDTERYLSVEQAGIITCVYKENEGLPVMIKRALALARSLAEIQISIDPEELVAGNRTSGIRAGVVFPEAGISWLEKEIVTLPSRPQDPFNVREEDSKFFLNAIVPYWKGKTLEDDIYGRYGNEIKKLEPVVKINQKDHAQGHICPDVSAWLRYGPAGLLALIEEKRKTADMKELLFFECTAITLAAAMRFMTRYANLAYEMALEENEPLRKNLLDISEVCLSISKNPPAGYREAVQSVWFLFVILQMESNASSFSPGRMDQYLYPFYEKDRNSGVTVEFLQEITDSLFIKFNQIVYMRNSDSARYFAGFPTGFNITVGGRDEEGNDATNDLSSVFLKAQDHVRLPQPNLTVRLHHNSTRSFLDECSRVIGLGTGMPQIVNDENIIPALEYAGIDKKDAQDYALVGCVEISPQGNYLGWSDAAMFNMVKVLELTLNDGKCMLTGEQSGPQTGTLASYRDYHELEEAFGIQLDHFTEKMVLACEVAELCHREHLPSPFLSAVVSDCIKKGTDVTAGGAKYNYSGIQAIQAANVADSLAALRKLVYEEKSVDSGTMLSALKNNFSDNEILRQRCINHVPKYGNDEPWVDETGAKWVKYFAEKLKKYRNLRGGPYVMGLYTVSAHVPMGRNVAATPDGRLSGTPLADGGLSPMYGRDKKGPTAVLNSVSKIPSHLAPNGTLLNLKFLPQTFSDNTRSKFTALLRSFVHLPVHHVQFNVVTAEELKKAKADPHSYRGLTIRVAGYTAFFTELESELQDEIIRRTTHGE